MAKRLHNTQIEECLKHYKHMDLLRHKQLFYMFILNIIYSDIMR